MENENKEKRFELVAETLIDLIKKQQIDRGLYASGKTAKTLRSNITQNRIQILGSEAFIYQIKGRGPGKFPPPNTIKDWIKAKPIRSKLNINSLSFLIGRSIAEKGSLIYQGKKKGLDMKEVVREGFKIDAEAFTDSYQIEIDAAIKNNQPR